MLEGPPVHHHKPVILKVVPQVGRPWTRVMDLPKAFSAVRPHGCQVCDQGVIFSLLSTLVARPRRGKTYSRHHTTVSRVSA